MNKKILTSMAVLSGLLFGGDVFAADYINITGEGICEMALPANAVIKKKKNDNRNFEFSVSQSMFFDAEDDEKYVGFDRLLKKIHQVLPDAVITSYKYNMDEGDVLFNIDTKLQKDLIGLVVDYNYNEEEKDIEASLTNEFKSSKEYLDCKNMAIKSAMQDVKDKAKILKAKIVSTDTPKYGSYEHSYVYKIENGNMRYYYKASYKAVAD